MRIIAAQALIIVFILGSSSGLSRAIVSPKHGGPLPSQLRAFKEKSKSAFTLKHAWIARRENQVRGDARYALSTVGGATAIRDVGHALRGGLAIPVILGQYSTIADPPFTREAFDREFFSGPWPTGTLGQYWREVSYNLFDVSGTVFDWVPLSHAETYYTGGYYSGLDTLHSKTGDLIKEVLDTLDPTVNFGLFDNDGPDGVPNSADDDGFVDVLLVIHPTYGAECDNSAHMWSHSWNYSAWPVSGRQPYRTNDPAAGGGVVRIDDYIIVPALSCETGIIEIGVICHELGHAFGLPDLYDYDGGASGIGDWGLMGTGNWNTPVSPAHLCAWSKEQVGWINPVEIDWRTRTLSLRPIETSGDAAKIALPTVRFKRQLYAPGSHALLCAYGSAEAGTREWPKVEGYGNGWNEAVRHEFSVDASRPVTVQYDVSINVEPSYDFGRLLLETDGVVETLMVYTGVLSRHEVIDLSDRLPSGACTFALRFGFTSDVSVSDEDGYYDSPAGNTFNIDNVSVNGGGLDYGADFELDSGGWRNDSAPAEYFIVENRRKAGFDANLLGQGMLIWHAENSIAYTFMGNSGGLSNEQARGLVLEEADGDYDLLAPSSLGGNFGDGGDPYPGTEGNRSFGPTTIPRNQTNGGVLSPVVIDAITYGASTSSASFTGGMPAPVIAAVSPDTIDKRLDGTATFDIRGSGIRYGANVYLSLGIDTVVAQEMTWLGEERVIATFAVEELYAGEWDMFVVVADGQTQAEPKTIDIISVYLATRVSLAQDNLRIHWTLNTTDGVRGCRLYRSADGGAYTAITPDTLRSASGEFEFVDTSTRPGVSYAYKIVTYLNGGREEVFAFRDSFGSGPIHVLQNYPNPFSEKTLVGMSVPVAQRVRIDIYDVSGRLVAHLAEREFDRGTQTVSWNPRDHGARAGVYFCVFRAAGVTKGIKMIYLP